MACARPMRSFRWLGLLCLLLAGILPLAHAQQQGSGRVAPIFTIDGAIGPATADHIVRGMAKAAEEGAPMVIIRMDTPGGLDTSMRAIIRGILASPVPVVTYVSPSGARAASAGAFILISSHVAAMAPGTNVGAATPVQMGAPSPFGAPDPKDDKADKQAAPKGGSASEAKALNDAIAYIRSLAEMRNRNADWAEAAVREAASLSAQMALKQKAIDVVARDDKDLLRQLDGRIVRVGTGQVRLDTDRLVLTVVEQGWRTRFLVAITNPNIALILMMIGLYGLLFEFMNPGALYPGVIGTICLLLGFYSLSVLPVNLAGVALMLLGVALMAAEAFAPSFGILGIGGAAALALGAAILFDSDLPAFRIALPVVAAVALASLGATLLTVGMAVRSRRSRVVSGREQMIGALASVTDWRGDQGHVHVHGERWRARSPVPLRQDQNVRVSGIDGLTLTVEPSASDQEGD